MSVSKIRMPSRVPLAVCIVYNYMFAGPAVDTRSAYGLLAILCGLSRASTEESNAKTHPIQSAATQHGFYSV